MENLPKTQQINTLKTKFSLMQKETIIISLGGSLIVPDKIDWKFLKSFKNLILKHLKTKRFIIITGGGSLARNYINAAGNISNITPEDKDWLGIHATRINAHLLRTIFKEKAYPRIIKNPNEKFISNEDIILAAGYRPGCSTDYDAVLLAKNLKANAIINLTNINYVYKKDPKKFKNQKPIKKISWDEFQKIVGTKWKAGMNVPFDPIATKQARKLKLTIYMLNGKKINNLNNLLNKKKFIGTAIS